MESPPSNSQGPAAREKIFNHPERTGWAGATSGDLDTQLFFFYRAGIRRERISDENFTACRDHTILFLANRVGNFVGCD